VTREPVALGAAVLVLVQAVTALVVAFGVDVTPEQAAAILAASTAVVGVLVALGVRRLVSPVATLDGASGGRHLADG